MKKSYLALVALAMTLSASTYAQSHRNCGTMHHLEEQIAADPSTATRMEQIERETENWISNSSTNKSAAVVTIPVVVHVLYSTAAQNISDAQIQSQIAILNADFRKLNSDISLVPSVFAGLAADCQIQFCLAQRDPSGNATTGIVRKSTTVTSFSSNDNIKRNANGGSDPWNTAQYLNIWVGNLGGGLLGYAQFPGGAAATDGIVVLNTAFGNTGTAAAPFNKGRTATHEIGHWLNLRHIWGDASCGNDQVADTPTQQTSNVGCPAFPRVTCSNGPNGDMHMNYMDYTNDACMYMFTTGQSSRMTAAINTSRSGLITSLGCTPPSTTGCGTPSGLAASSITTTTATLGWSAVSGAVSYNVQYRLVGATTWTTTTSTTTSRAITGLVAGSSYEFQVQAVCSTSTGTFSGSTGFTTTATACSDIYEANNTRTTAKTIAVNTNISAVIGTSTDQDWFRFSTVTGATNIRLNLDLLPADYDLKLFSSTGTQLAVSQLGGTTAETITRNTTTAATYFAQVYGYASAFNAQSCYRLRVNASGNPFRSASGNPIETEQNINVSKVTGASELNIFPNPANDKLTLSFFNAETTIITFEIFDMIGKSIENKVFNAEEGFNNAEFDLSSFNNGIYFVKMIQNDETTVKKFIVKH